MKQLIVISAFLLFFSGGTAKAPLPDPKVPELDIFIIDQSLQRVEESAHNLDKAVDKLKKAL